MSTSSYATPSSRRTSRACSQRWQPCAVKRTTLGIDAAGHGCFRNALDRKAVRGTAHRDVPLLHLRPRLVERLRDDVVELRVDLGLLPEVLLETLDPLEVRHDHAARVR